MTFGYPQILRSYIYPLSQKIRKRDYLRMMEEASRNQYLSQEKLRLIQFKKLQNTLLQNDSHKQIIDFAIHQFIENLKLQRNKLGPMHTGWEHNKL